MKMVRACSMFRLAILVAVLISTSEAGKVSPAPKLAAGAIPCTIVIPKIAPCREYIDTSKPNPFQSCCNGVKDIIDMSKTKQDRVEACDCIQQALSSLRKYDPNRIPLISDKCGLSFSLPAINKDSDCNKIVPPDF